MHPPDVAAHAHVVGVRLAEHGGVEVIAHGSRLLVAAEVTDDPAGAVVGDIYLREVDGCCSTRPEVARRRMVSAMA